MFIERLLTLPQHHTLLLFGARGVGKSFLLEAAFNFKDSLYINLLDPLEEARFARNPSELIELVNAMLQQSTHVIIDEVQKVPKLLDVVHLLIESEKSDKLFILTGSSARKLKANGVNLLAGRAFVYHLYPFSYIELNDQFNFEQALMWGMLPKLFSSNPVGIKKNFYSHMHWFT